MLLSVDFVEVAMAPFNAVLKEVRLERGLTPKQAAARIGWTQSFVGAYEKDHKNPTIRTLFKLARAYDLQITIDRGGVRFEDKKTGDLLLAKWNPLPRSW